MSKQRFKRKKKPLSLKQRLEVLEGDVNEWLGFPQERGSEYATYYDENTNADVEDALRHAFTSMETSKAIQSKMGNVPVLSNIAGFLGANYTGLGHEIRGAIKNPSLENLESSTKDIYNNLIGSFVGSFVPGDREANRETLNSLTGSVLSNGQSSMTDAYEDSKDPFLEPINGQKKAKGTGPNGIQANTNTKPKKPIRSKYKTLEGYAKAISNYKGKLHSWRLNNDPERLPSETDELYALRTRMFERRRKENITPQGKAWEGVQDYIADMGDTMMGIPKLASQVLTSPINLAYGFSEKIDVTDTEKYKTKDRKFNDTVDIFSDGLDALSLALSGKPAGTSLKKKAPKMLVEEGLKLWGREAVEEEVFNNIKKGEQYAKGTDANGVQKTKDMKAKKKTSRKKRSLKTYAVGTDDTGVIQGYYPNPSEVFAQQDIDIAQAQYEAATNPWIMGGKAVGGVIAANSNAIGNGIMDVTKGPKVTAAMGSGPQGMGQVPIEAEKGEVAETPDGQVTEIGGQKHAQGGTDLDVPEGTKIFSDQLKVAGKTMADRKKAREKQLSKLQKSIDKDPTDVVAKNTFKKMSEKFAIEEQQDLELQGFAGQLDEIYNYAMGTNFSGVTRQKKAWGDSFIKATGPYSDLEGNTIIPEGFEYPDETGDGHKVANAGITLGDGVGMAGSLYGGIAPMYNTMKNRAGDTVNKNHFSDFGVDGLAALEESKGYIQGQQDKNIKDINLSGKSAIKSARNSSRGVNTNRALEQGVFTNMNKAKSDVYNNFSKQMMQILSTQGTMENAQDQMVMQGAGVADEANRMDRDNYATQLGADKVNMGNMFQNLGKNLNVQKGNQDFLDMLPDLSAYGLGYTRGKNGKLEIQKINE